MMSITTDAFGASPARRRYEELTVRPTTRTTYVEGG
jgi:hypothetical protein